MNVSNNESRASRMPKGLKFPQQRRANGTDAQSLTPAHMKSLAQHSLNFPLQIRKDLIQTGALSILENKKTINCVVLQDAFETMDNYAKQQTSPVRMVSSEANSKSYLEVPSHRSIFEPAPLDEPPLSAPEEALNDRLRRKTIQTTLKKLSNDTKSLTSKRLEAIERLHGLHASSPEAQSYSKVAKKMGVTRARVYNLKKQGILSLYRLQKKGNPLLYKLLSFLE